MPLPPIPLQYAFSKAFGHELLAFWTEDGFDVLMFKQVVLETTEVEDEYLYGFTQYLKGTPAADALAAVLSYDELVRVINTTNSN